MKSNFLKFFTTIPNVRTLRSHDLASCLEMVRDMHEKTADGPDSHFLQSISEPLMLAASNLGTIS